MKGKKLAALGLGLAMTLSLLTVPAGAVTFTDISSHWAKSYIEDMAAEGMVKGYEDNTYRPDKTLSVAEGLAFCARSLQVDQDTAQAVLAKHEEYLDDMLGNEHSWFRTEFALCLESGILTKTEFKSLIQNGGLDSDKTMSKQDLSRYLVRAMGLDLLAESQSSYPLGFQDADNITAENRPSVYLLNMYGIVTGDEKNVFDTQVNRAIMATMLSRVLSFKEERGIETELADFTEYDWTSGTVSGITTSDLGVTVLTLDNGFGGEPEALTLSGDVKIYENNMQTTLKAVKTGAFVRVGLDKKGVAESVRIYGELETVSGKISSLTGESVLFTLGGVPKTVTMDRFTLVQAGGVVGDPSTLDLGSGYTAATALVDGRGKAVAIQFRGGSSKRTGLFAGRETITGSEDLVLKITGYDGVTQRYVLPADVTITVNGAPGKVSSLKSYTGKYVELRVSDDTGLVTAASFDTATEYLQGSVRAITWQSSTPTMSITDLASGKSTSYSVSKDVSVTYNGESVEFKNVAKDWFLTARFAGGEIVELICYPGTTISEGTLVSVDYSTIPQVTLAVKDENGATLDFVLDINDLPVIKRDGSTSSIDRLKSGDTVAVTVKYNEVTLIEATARTANLSGTIQSISQTVAGDTITVKLTDGSEATYAVTTSTSITKDGKAVAFSTLKVGYQISMLTDGERLVAIEVNNATVSSDKLEGTVVYVNTSDKTILFKENGAESPISISASTAKIMSTGGATLRLSDLGSGDNLTIYGSYNGLVFQATMILR